LFLANFCRWRTIDLVSRATKLFPESIVDRAYYNLVYKIPMNGGMTKSVRC